MRSKLQEARRLPGLSRSALIKATIATAIAPLLVHWKIDVVGHRRLDERPEVKRYGNRSCASASGYDTHWFRTGRNPHCLSAGTGWGDPGEHRGQDRRTTTRPDDHGPNNGRGSGGYTAPP